MKKKINKPITVKEEQDQMYNEAKKEIDKVKKEMDRII